MHLLCRKSICALNRHYMTLIKFTTDINQVFLQNQQISFAKIE